MVTVSFRVGRADLNEIGDEIYDMGFFMKYRTYDTHQTFNSPLILRKVTLKHEDDLDSVFFAYDLIDKATWKVLGKTEVYDDDDWMTQADDFRKNILEVAEQYPGFMDEVKKYKYPEIVSKIEM